MENRFNYSDLLFSQNNISTATNITSSAIGLRFSNLLNPKSDMSNSFDYIASYYNYYHSKNLSKNLWIYLSPFIFFTGMIGNILILIVLSSKSLKSRSTCIYLKSMAVADLIVLLTGMVPEWLDYMSLIVLKETHPITCKMEKFMNFTAADTSIWICVAFTIDRLMAVCFPMKECTICLPNNVKFHVVTSLICSFIKNLHFFWTRGAEYALKTSNDPKLQNTSIHNTSSLLQKPTQHLKRTFFLQNTSSYEKSYKLVTNCGSPTQEFKYFEEFIRPWIAFVLISLLPCLIMVTSNILIIRSICFKRKKKNKIPADHEAGTVRLLTILCLTASICFIVCNLPSIIMLIFKPYWKHTRAYHLAKPFVNQIFFINHAINFFLYCITGKKFRKTLKNAFCFTSKRLSISSRGSMSHRINPVFLISLKRLKIISA